MLNRLLLALFSLSILTIVFVSGWAVSNYNFGYVNLWMQQSFEQAFQKIKKDEPEDVIITEVKEDTDPIALKKPINDDMVTVENIQFSRSAMKGMPPIMIAPTLTIKDNKRDFLVAEYKDGNIEVSTLEKEDSQPLQGEPYLIDGSRVFLKEKKNEAKHYSRFELKDGKAHLVWRKNINQSLHHFGELYEGIAYIPGRQHFRMGKDKEMQKLFKGKNFSRCKPNQTLVSEVIVKIDWEKGEMLEQIPLLPAVSEILAHDPYMDVVLGGQNCADNIHLNDIRLVKTQSQADLFPQGKIGDMIVSMRNINTIMLLDRDTHKLKWHVTGLFHHQHSPRLTSRGTMLVYDNLGSLPKNGLNRIVEIDIKTKSIVGVYEARDDDIFFSAIRGRLQLLGDRIFVQEHEGGKFFEIVCNEDEYISTECEKQLIFEVNGKTRTQINFNLGEFVEFTSPENYQSNDINDGE